MRLQSYRGRALTLLAASLAFAACTPLPTGLTEKAATTAKKKKPVASPAASTGPVVASSPMTLPQTDGTLSKPSSPPQAPSVSPSKSPSPSPSVSPSPSASPSASVSPTPTPTPTPADEEEETVPSASQLIPTTVSGFVYDEEGAQVSVAKVRVESLNPANPYDTLVDVSNGAYVVNEVPAGVQVRITAYRDGWTTRSRVTTLLPIGESGRNTVNFGGGENDQDPAGPAYFISDYPEVERVEPADDADNVIPDTVAIRLTLSEPLDPTNQRRFADAIHVLPGSPEAAGNQGTLDTSFLDEDEQATTAIAPFTLPDAVYTLDEDSTFLGDDDTMASVTWDSSGRVATLTFNAPLLANTDDNLRYCVALFSEGTGIEDDAGNALGTDETGVLDGTIGADELIYFAFREPSLAVPSGATMPDTVNERWQATHENFTEFRVAEDDVDPVLTGTVVSMLSDKTRISLVFSEPMAAFGGGANGIFGDINFIDLTFAIAETAADLDDVTLDGDAPTPRLTTVTNLGDTSDEREAEFSLVSDAGAPMTIFANPDDPKVLRVEFANPDFFADQVNAIKVRAEGFEDPAGNSITEASADRNEVVGNI